MEGEEEIKQMEELMEKLRQNLHRLANKEKKSLQNPEVLLLSCELDALIVKYMELKKK
jgi:hypothetical protein